MKRFDFNAAYMEMSILADALDRAERAHDYESGHYDDNLMRYNKLKQQIERYNKRRDK
jgi:hypothetical protein